MGNLYVILFLFLVLPCYGQTVEKYQRVNKNKYWGFVDENGKEIIPLGLYEFLNPIDERDMILAKKNGKDGYIDIHQNIIIPFEYDDLGVFSSEKELAPAKRNGKSGAINRKGETIVPFIYDNVNYFYKSGLAIVVKNGKYGFVNGLGVEVIPAIYEKVDQSMSDEIVLVSQNKKWAFFSNEGKQLTDFKFDEIKESYIKKDGRNKSTFWKGGLAIATINGENQYFDKDLNLIIPTSKYEYSESLNVSGFGIVGKDDKYGVINNKGIEVIPLEYLNIEHPKRYSDNLELFVLEKDRVFTILDENLQTIKQNISSYDWDKVDFGEYTLDGLLVKDSQNRFGIIDEKGNEIIPFDYEDLHFFDGEENTIAKKNGKYGMINFNNQVSISFDYDTIQSGKFSKVLVMKKDGKFGVFDVNGKKIIDFVYEDLQPCFYDENNKFIIKINGKYGIIDASGKEIISAEYDEITNWVEYGPEAHFVIKNKKYGIFSREGRQLVPAIYDDLRFITGEIIIVSKNNQYGVINIKNKIVIPLKYDKIYVDWYRTAYQMQAPEIYVLKDNIYSQFDENNKQIRTNIPEEEVKGNFEDYIEVIEPELELN